ncbi:hypothetical protein AGMMS49991_11080 [Spirochaetia bacterium]|nr:hypothetical protein AGMMS49991_11080 [Spirochaetia bacterium]
MTAVQGYFKNNEVVIDDNVFIPDGARLIVTVLDAETEKTEFGDESDMDAPDWAKKSGITYSDFQRDVTDTIKRVRAEKRAKFKSTG